MMEYIFISTFGLGISYLLYQLLLKNEKSFKFNRFYLLGSLILCLLAPILQLDLGSSFSEIPKIEMKEVASDFFPPEIPEGKTVEKLERKSNWAYQVLLFGYFIVTSLFLLRFFRNLFQIFKHLKNNKSLTVSGLKAIPIQQKVSPYSFFNFLFINEEDLEKRSFSEAIIQHELAHSNQFHSIDVIFMELLTCFLWFNPFLWLYKKAIVENHEFLADAQVMKSEIDVDSYSHQLIETENRNIHVQYPLISGFNFNQTKNRIIMLYKKRNSKQVLALKTGMVLGLFSIVFAITACTSNLETDAKPFVVVLDAGHGGKDPGFLIEKTINLGVAKKLAALSENGEIKIILIRKNDKFISLGDRVEFTKNQNADLFLSLHCNGSNDENQSGVIAFYARNGIKKAQSHRYSEILVSNYLEEIAEKGEIATVGFRVLRELKIPGVMLELGFLSNEKEAQQLKNPEFQQKIAENIYGSLLEIKESR